MSFRPVMTAFTEGIHAVDALLWRAWDGVVADLWHAEGIEGGGGHYLSPDPRVVIFLDDGASAIRLSDTPCGTGSYASGRIFYVPADMPLWSQIVQTRRFRHLDLHFDKAMLASRLTRQFGAAQAQAALARPVMLDDHPGITQIAALLAAEVQVPAQHSHYADGLVQALLTALLGLGGDSIRQQAARGGLTPLQVRRLTELMQTSLNRRVPIAELASHIGLSESWFARAFKQTTGETPLAWQQRLRIDCAKTLLGEDSASLAEIAAATGFADQAHMTRIFRSATGATPGAWRRGSVA